MNKNQARTQARMGALHIIAGAKAQISQMRLRFDSLEVSETIDVVEICMDRLVESIKNFPENKVNPFVTPMGKAGVATGPLTRVRRRALSSKP